MEQVTNYFVKASLRSVAVMAIGVTLVIMGSVILISVIASSVIWVGTLLLQGRVGEALFEYPLASVVRTCLIFVAMTVIGVIMMALAYTGTMYEHVPQEQFNEDHERWSS